MKNKRPVQTRMSVRAIFMFIHGRPQGIMETGIIEIQKSILILLYRGS
jgi:hypothetical protein